MKINKNNVSFSACSASGVITDLEVIYNGTLISPLHKTKWIKALPSSDNFLLDNLQGEFLCLPFGSDRLPTHPSWNTTTEERCDCFLHGYGANHNWDIKKNDDNISMSIKYPASHPIDQVTKTCEIIHNGIDISYTITAKEQVADRKSVV